MAELSLSNIVKRFGGFEIIHEPGRVEALLWREKFEAGDLRDDDGISVGEGAD